ncbi:MAG: OmpA family protein [Saprospiraceae bacterium]|nr:OmpA family protein [Saprospiraceae bacterium]MDZ4703857.1 OmpA family protein [Saprospiraceae bacterium]
MNRFSTSSLIRIFLLLLNSLFFWVPNGVQAQQSNDAAAKAYRDGELALLEKKYKRALQFFEEAIVLQPEFAIARRAAGLCCEQLNEYDKALRYYEGILRVNPTFSRVLYYQTAELHYKTGDYRKALGYFREYERLRSDAFEVFGLNGEQEVKLEPELDKKLMSNIRACEVSLDSLKFVNLTDVNALGSAINTAADEYFPFLTNDQALIYFNRRKNERSDENLFFSRLENNQWATGKQVGGFNTPRNEGMCTFVRDGRRMYFTACNREGGLGPCDIWEAAVDGVEMTNLQPLQGKANSERWESQAAISCDGTKLFFASNRPGGIGGTDLWYCLKQADGTWGEATNLGSQINTELDEEAPFITNDGKTLYFSSTGHLGLGEQDIFMSWIDERSGNWSPPINIGPPVNSPFRELGFFLSADGVNGLFASNRPGAKGGMDIYAFKLSEQLYSDPITFVEGFVKDSVLDVTMQATVEIAGRAPITTEKDGRFFLCIGAQETVDIRVGKKYYKPYQNQFLIPEWDNRNFYTIEVLLQPTSAPPQAAPVAANEEPELTSKGKTLREYHHIVYFDFDKSAIEADEILKIDKFLSPLRDKTIQKAEIVGFADDIGADVYNLRLSEERAKNIALLLTSNGFIVDRIYMEGKGEVQNTEEKSKNRRVEVKIFTWE